MSTVSMSSLVLHPSSASSLTERIWPTSPRLPSRSSTLSRARVSTKSVLFVRLVLTMYQALRSGSRQRTRSAQTSSISSPSTRPSTRSASTVSVSLTLLAVPTHVKFTSLSARSVVLSSAISRSTCTTTQEWVSDLQFISLRCD